MLKLTDPWAPSSAGRALRSHRRGHRFESCGAHHFHFPLARAPGKPPPHGRSVVAATFTLSPPATSLIDDIYRVRLRTRRASVAALHSPRRDHLPKAVLAPLRTRSDRVLVTGQTGHLGQPLAHTHFGTRRRVLTPLNSDCSVSFKGRIAGTDGQ